MNDKLSMPLLLVSGSQFTQNTLVKQLRVFLPESVKIVAHLTDDRAAPEKGTYFAVFSSQEVYREFEEQNASNEAILDEYIVAERTMFKDNIEKLLALPRNERILLVNESEESTFESINLLKKIGFDFLKLEPYYPGYKQPDNDIKIAITPGEIDLVPPGIDAVYDLGPRNLEFAAIVRIITYYGLIDGVLPEYADTYMRNLMNFARNLSNVADETSRVMTTVRRELIGSGHYARYRFSDIIGCSRALMEAKEIAEKVARTNLTVLIEGENGTGKELLASAIHNASDRCRKPFVAINLSALPDQLIESELFGYEEGAFTGARKKGKIGLFQQAAGGTIFLDEIGDISPKMQTKLLRVIQERQIMRVGGNRIIPVDVRIIAATNRNLKKMIKENEFRKDLYYRLHEGYVHLPSLAARREDIPMLIEYWQKELFASEKKISKDGMRLLMKHDWPGNVRELQNLVKFAFAVCENDVITARDLPFLNEVFEDTKLYIEEETLAEISENLSLPDRISMAVLIAAAELQQDGKLVGRSSIMKHLQGYEDQEVKSVSEYRVRKCLDKLQKEGYLVKEGGYGLKMSDKAEGVLIQK